MTTQTLLLKEYYALDRSNVTINKADNQYVLRGIIQRANALNGNGRVYEKKILMRECNKYDQFINEKRSLGELDHCNSTEVNLKNASHILEQYEWRGDDLHGSIRLLSTPAGQIAKNLIDDGVTLGISTRGLGSVTQESNGTVKVNEDYHLVCWDLVHDPSTTGAFMLKEGKYIKIEETNNAMLSENRSFENKIQDIVNQIMRKR